MVKVEEVLSEDEEGSESGEESEEEVLLGFVEEPANADLLERHFFPSKVGGVPAWLDPVKLPSESATICGFCEKPLVFLMQVYGPLDSESAFHRTLFVFVCKSNSCLRRHFRQQEERDRKRSVRVFRCQLGRHNPFYSFDPAKPGTLPPASETIPALCDWCGTWAVSKRCGGCRDYGYCSKAHQVEHWKAGHVSACKRLDKQAASTNAAPTATSPTPTPALGSPSAHRVANGITAQIVGEPGLAEEPSGNELRSGMPAGSVNGSDPVESRDSVKSGNENTGQPEAKSGVESSRGLESKRGVSSSGLRGGGERADTASVSSSPVESAGTDVAGGKAVDGLKIDDESLSGLRAQLGGLSVDDAGFPVSTVDWESGGVTVSGDRAEDSAGVGGTEQVLGNIAGALGKHDDVRGSAQVGNDVSESKQDVTFGGSEPRAGTDPSVASRGESSSDTANELEQTGLRVKKDPVKEDGVRKHGKTQTTKRVKGKSTELIAVVKPRALDPKLWPELELIVESESEYQGEAGVSGRGNNGLGDVSALLEQYGKRVEKNREFSAEDLEEAEAGMRDLAGDRKQWAEFEARLAGAPEQVMRYCRSVDAKPLWPSTIHRPSPGAIEPCPHCGNERIFEFQVLPQLLYYMHVDSSNPETLDWGTIAVYTCSKSCPQMEGGYLEEAVWVQLPQ